MTFACVAAVKVHMTACRHVYTKPYSGKFSLGSSYVTKFNPQNLDSRLDDVLRACNENKTTKISV